MIQYIKRKNLDVDKYDACIENSVQSRIYAFSWYLDIVADNWGVLVLGDYKAVMPIPWKKKYFLKYIAQPVFCQQLGVFSKEITSQELQEKMLKCFPKNFVKISLNFNSDNSLNAKNTALMKNYILELNDTYEMLFKSFSKGRKHAVKVGEKNNLSVKNTKIVELINIKNKFYDYSGFSESKLTEICNYTSKTNSEIVLGVFKDDVLIGGGVFLTFDDRITYLFSAFNAEGRKLQAASFLIKSIIERNEKSNLILDFEGGNLPNIATFFKSFGANVEEYQQFTSQKFPFL
ncbi:hypothetical protein [Polaribacter sp. SA4-12]|uniref:hypothetical protein n=1 Tax=Polaribacter sp. SA4-12 TaxID=1312072 RepID=UPI000B3BF081|nr:hypothetical protein [Polaribacter sp. SA4-12]ARV16676.1 hypothetical protein BTO07_16695 [Polaribacter sp. SA4-12]